MHRAGTAQGQLQAAIVTVEQVRQTTLYISVYVVDCILYSN